MGKKGGKAPTGRAKQKQKAQRGPGSSPWQPPSGKVRHGWSDDDDDDFTPQFRGFAQSNRMPSTSSPSAARLELRHRKVAFISAGAATPPIEDKHHFIEGEEKGEKKTEDGPAVEQSDVTMETDVPHQGMADMDIQDAVPETSDVLAHNSSEPHESDLFVVDTAGDDKLTTTSRDAVRPIVRASSPAPSDSSEEQVVFLGRNKPKVINDPAPAIFAKSNVQALKLQPKAASSPSDTKVSSQLKSADAWDLAMQLDPTPSTTIAFGDPPAKLATSEHAQDGRSSTTAAARQSGSGPVKELNAEDTIASLQAGWKETLQEKRKAKSDAAAASYIKVGSSAQIPNRRGKKGRKRGNRALKAAYVDSDDDQMDEAAYDDYMENLAAQLDDDVEETTLVTKLISGEEAFARSSGLGEPSLVVDGRAYGENEKLPRHLKTPNAKDRSTDEVDDSDEWESDDSEGSSASSDEDDQSDLEDEVEYSERQMWEDEDDLRERRIQQIEDEELARLFSKQEELGIEGDELMIESGIYMDGIGDIDAARKGLADLTNLVRPSKRTPRRRARGEPTFVDASALADTLDQYGDNGFDIMDFDRPSLRPTKKGRKGKLPPELEALSDEELRDNMMFSWENDRNKKRLKKLEREELRMDGLLGKGARTGISDLTAKYATGMTLRQVFDELHEFLLLDLEQRAFPPMAKSDRKALHEVCTRLNLNSKSQGAGKRRFPIITKTSRTPGPGDPTFEEFISFARSGTLGNVGQVYKLRNSLNRAGKGRERPTRNAGASKAGTMLRNGEIVGASAAKIGSESFGHRMMQKMGWQEGKGLGQTGEGMTNPVEQRMRFGTAGLG